MHTHVKISMLLPNSSFPSREEESFHIFCMVSNSYSSSRFVLSLYLSMQVRKPRYRTFTRPPDLRRTTTAARHDSLVNAGIDRRFHLGHKRSN